MIAEVRATDVQKRRFAQIVSKALENDKLAFGTYPLYYNGVSNNCGSKQKIGPIYVEVAIV
jgi:hypothetical protein